MAIMKSAETPSNERLQHSPEPPHQENSISNSVTSAFRDTSTPTAASQSSKSSDSFKTQNLDALSPMDSIVPSECTFTRPPGRSRMDTKTLLAGLEQIGFFDMSKFFEEKRNKQSQDNYFDFSVWCQQKWCEANRIAAARLHLCQQFEDDRRLERDGQSPFK
jgi:hypothetical protein